MQSLKYTHYSLFPIFDSFWPAFVHGKPKKSTDWDNLEDETPPFFDRWTLQPQREEVEGWNFPWKFTSGLLLVSPLWFLVANKQLYIRVCPSVRRSVGPSVRGPWSRVFFSNRGIQEKKWSNFHQCPCPTFATIGRPVRLVYKHTLFGAWAWEIDKDSY